MEKKRSLKFLVNLLKSRFTGSSQFAKLLGNIAKIMSYSNGMRISCYKSYFVSYGGNFQLVV